MFHTWLEFLFSLSLSLFENNYNPDLMKGPVKSERTQKLTIMRSEMSCGQKKDFLGSPGKEKKDPKKFLNVHSDVCVFVC